MVVLFDAKDETELLRDVCKRCGMTVEFAKGIARKTNIGSRENVSTQTRMIYICGDLACATEVIKGLVLYSF